MRDRCSFGSLLYRLGPRLRQQQQLFISSLAVRMSGQRSIVGATAPPPGVTPDFEHPQDVLHTVNLVSQILAIAIVTPVVGLRLWARWRISPHFLLDDCKLPFLPASGGLRKSGSALTLSERKGVVSFLV